ncbi:hypothetical protein A943_16165 [Bacillus sp. CPSM8]|nr:hypothetical protein A943_16165 [Bacillus sp. CPSM8]
MQEAVLWPCKLFCALKREDRFQFAFRFFFFSSAGCIFFVAVHAFQFTDFLFEMFDLLPFFFQFAPLLQKLIGDDIVRFLFKLSFQLGDFLFEQLAFKLFVL